MDGSTLAQFQFEVARDKGFFKDEGITATFQQLAGPLNTAQVVSGQINYALSNSSQLDPATAQGAPLRMLAVWGTKTTIDLVGAKGIDTLEKLRNGTISTPSASSQHEVWTKQILKDKGNGLLESIKFNHVNASSSSAQLALLQSGQIQGSVVSIDNVYHLGPDYPLIYDFASEASPFFTIGQGLATQLPYAQSHADQTRAVIRALTKAAEYMKTNEDGSWAFIGRIWNLQEPEARKVWKAMSVVWTTNPIPNQQQLDNSLALDKLASPDMANVSMDQYKANYLDFSYVK